MDSTIQLLSEDQYTLVYNALSFGTAVMLGAFVYFLTQMSAVNKGIPPRCCGVGRRGRYRRLPLPGSGTRSATA